LALAGADSKPRQFIIMSVRDRVEDWLFEPRSVEHDLAIVHAVNRIERHSEFAGILNVNDDLRVPFQRYIANPSTWGSAFFEIYLISDSDMA
jgi:hypothetical protein